MLTNLSGDSSDTLQPSYSVAQTVANARYLLTLCIAALGYIYSMVKAENPMSFESLIFYILLSIPLLISCWKGMIVIRNSAAWPDNSRIGEAEYRDARWQIASFFGGIGAYVFMLLFGQTVRFLF